MPPEKDWRAPSDQAGDDAKAIAALEKEVDAFGKDNGIRPGVLRR